VAGKIARARTALRRGGVPELVRATRTWLSVRIAPAALSRVVKPVAEPVPVPAAPPRPGPADVVDHATAMAWFAPRRHTYQRLSEAVTEFVDPDGLVLDVGANVGFFSKVLGETLDFHGTVHLFEPVPNLAALCHETLRDAPFEAVVHAYGLSDEDATLDIFIAADGNLGWNTMIAGRASAGMMARQIRVRPFDDVQLDAVPCFIKIDVEGAEYKVLQGMLAALERWSPRPTILCEIGWGSPRHPNWDEELEVFTRLENLGYRAVNLNQVPVDLTAITRTTDVLFLCDDPDGRSG